jgi:hypothetical protein
MPVALSDVACVEIPDKPGSLVKFSLAMEKAGINVTDAYGCILERGKRAVFIVKGENLDAIEQAAKDAGLKILNSLS